MAIIGIDLGTTNSLAAVWREGRCQLIPNASGGYLTPSVVSVEDDGSILVGQAARERLVSHPERTVSCFKRYMGTRQIFTLGKQSFRPEELSALVLRRLREDAECFLGEPVTEAVISVPAYFNESQRAATKRAGALAGLVVERLVNEPSAAALSAHIHSPDEEPVCLVFDLGGGTLDVSLVERFENVVSVTAVSGDNRLGGSDFDLAIAKAFCEETGIDFDRLSPGRQEILIRQAETCKIALTTQPATMMVVAFDGNNASLTLTNEWLIRRCSRLFKRLTAPIQQVLRDAGLSPQDLDELVMVGGSSHMPSVRQFIAKSLGLEPARDSHPDTAIAIGAGICAAMKDRCPDIREMVLTDVCPFTLGVAVFNAEELGRLRMAPIIERNSILPSSKENIFYTVRDRQKRVDVQVYQGEHPYCQDNTLLGTLSVPVPPGPKGSQSVRIRFSYDINGLLEVDCYTALGQTTKLLLQNEELKPREVEARLRALSALKLHPREQEVPRALLARVERLYTMALGPVRATLEEALSWYQRELSTQEPLRIGKASRKLEQLLDSVETYLGHDPLADAEPQWEPPE